MGWTAGWYYFKQVIYWKISSYEKSINQSSSSVEANKSLNLYIYHYIYIQLQGAWMVSYQIFSSLAFKESYRNPIFFLYFCDKETFQGSPKEQLPAFLSSPFYNLGCIHFPLIWLSDTHFGNLPAHNVTWLCDSVVLHNVNDSVVTVTSTLHHQPIQRENTTSPSYLIVFWWV